MEALTQTLECVDSEELVRFLQSDAVSLMSRTADYDLEVTDSFFDFSKIDDPKRTKTIKITLGHRIEFTRCIFIGSLRLENSQFENISFKNCQFIKPNFGVDQSCLKSLSFSCVCTKWLILTNSLLDCPVEIYQGAIHELKFNYVTCPRLWLQCMWNQSSTLSIYRFLGKKIYLPRDTAFEKLWLDHTILQQVEGNVSGVVPNIVKFD